MTRYNLIEIVGVFGIGLIVDIKSLWQVPLLILSLVCISMGSFLDGQKRLREKIKDTMNEMDSIVDVTVEYGKLAKAVTTKLQDRMTPEEKELEKALYKKLSER